MKDILQYIVESVVDNKDAIQIQEEEHNGFVSLTLTVAKDDMGKIIGKNGKVIKAIRNVLKIPAIKQNKKVNLTLAELPQ